MPLAARPNPPHHNLGVHQNLPLRLGLRDLLEDVQQRQNEVGVGLTAFEIQVGLLDESVVGSGIGDDVESLNDVLGVELDALERSEVVAGVGTLHCGKQL